ncbi:hypothetical protein [Nocardia seriolae]|uniref:YbjN domain-containing protein n=1 Tax=Nocardia seriolae TaxID=37332 RepID=A0A0B8N162_9NOCA|nr:hypothetical protein NS506_02884 [Nocardia seriolae]GEM22839.1 hypothetical protein NS2_10780 [Nocardia seriolae NBRC 15557]MTJ65246.1 hypothetical protein [Nocardia seriolae]MTJ70701.1 hypothetical protein [Nocardia seriolae]MTJ86836.1 hypothetical protein [Nocardia seriolae]
MTDQLTPAEELQLRAKTLLKRYGVDVREEEGALGFEYEGALCSLRGVNLSPGLDVLALMCILAWDRPIKPQLHKRVAERNAALQFGTLTVISREKQADVILRYTFPAAGLEDEPLATILLLTLSGASRARQGLLP